MLLDEINKAPTEFLDIQQGSEEWMALRKTKITATDAPVVMGLSPWKKPLQLYHEKLSNDAPPFPTERMQRGIDLEPMAKELFMLKTGIHVEPKVAVKGWAMASLDGITLLTDIAVEIKCPGERDHNEALLGMVPKHYYPQLQHQIWLLGLSFVYYFSFDGIDGVTIKVKRDDDFIINMLKEEKKFYECLIKKIPPEPCTDEYIERSDDLWYQAASQWKRTTQSIKELEKQEEDLRNQLILLSGGSNVKGAGISLCQVKRKGSVDYSRIPQLKNLDLDLYRKPDISTWRIQ